LSFSKAAEILAAIDSELMVLMDRKKMIFPNIETTAGLDKLAARYGLT
jgi:hypothetical protein